MRTYEYGNLDAQTVLIQPVDDHELPLMEKEWQEIRNLTDKDVLLIAVKVNSWNDDLSPWEAPAVFGKSGCPVYFIAYYARRISVSGKLED